MIFIKDDRLLVSKSISTPQSVLRISVVDSIMKHYLLKSFYFEKKIERYFLQQERMSQM